MPNINSTIKEISLIYGGSYVQLKKLNSVLKNVNLVPKSFNLMPQKSFNLVPKKSKLVGKRIKISAENIQKTTYLVDWTLSKQVCDVIAMFIVSTKIPERERSISPSSFYGQVPDY